MEKSQPLPKQTGGPDIQPGDPLAEAGRKVLRYQFTEMLSYEEGTRLGEDIEALHDMRVATRRMRAAFEVFGDALDPKALKPHLKGMRATGKALGRVRDLDVFMEKAGRYLNSLPEEKRTGLDPLLANWQVQREQARVTLLDHFDSRAYEKFKTNFDKFVNSPGAGARRLPDGFSPLQRVRDSAPLLIYARLGSVRAFEGLLGHASIVQLHALRIEFKKLRYTIEFFREVLGGEARQVINDLKKVQDHLGDLNDAQVATQILRTYLDGWDNQQQDISLQERQNPEGVYDYLAARYAERHQLMVTFPNTWERFSDPDFRRNLALAISVL